MVEARAPGLWPPRIASASGCAGLLGCLIWAGAVAPAERLTALSAVLAVGAVGAGVGTVLVRGRTRISSSFLVNMLAATFLGPASAFGVSTLGQLSIARVHPTRRLALIFNLVGNGAPALAVATVMRHAAPHDNHSVGFFALLGALAFGALAVSWAIVAPLFTALDGTSKAWSLRDWRSLLPVIVIDIVLTVSGAAIYVELGLPGIIFALVAVFAFSYQARLVAKAQQRSEQYVTLSWGVLAGLLRALDIRDQRAARHAAAVARFAGDMAAAVGMSEQECDLAHTSGLLHDIGHFALSDRVAERGRVLTDEDWEAIQRHPELGAVMLKDLGMYGPVAEIVLAHHERVDGRGYPYGLTGDEIPEIAKIIAVAEVYDTLTASDTYRTQMSSFEALRELRRVAGSQLDARYVEVLAQLLSGEGTDYRHANSADFDTELAMERRIKEARAADA
ncbi:MAG: HD domain-containing phosphohydrolase [Solirubrobacteraceae bacterium]